MNENPFPIGYKEYYSEDKEGDYRFVNPFLDYTLEEGTLFVPVGTKQKYQRTEGWKDFKNIVEIGSEKLKEGYSFYPGGQYCTISSTNPREVCIDCDIYSDASGLIPSVVLGPDGNDYTVTSIDVGQSYISTYSCVPAVIIPKTVTSFINKTNNRFYECRSIVVEDGNPIFDSREGCNAVIETATNKLVLTCKNSTIPNSVTAIGDAAFAYWKELTSFSIPNSITSIEDGAFAFCTGLTSLTIPNSVEYIGANAFYSCSGLTSVTIGKSVTSIGAYAFGNCSGLTTVTIPSTVTSIGYKVFSGCSNLKEIRSKILDPSRTASYSAFEGFPEDVPLYVPDGTKDQYKAAIGWNEFKNIIEGEPKEIFVYDTFEFNGVTYMVTSTNPFTVQVGDDQTAIPVSTTGELEIPSYATYDGQDYAVTSIGDYAFSNCSGLTSVTIPNSVTSIGKQAFRNCNGLTSVNIFNLEAWCKITFGDNLGSNPLYFAHHLYLNGQEIKDLVIPDGITSIENFGFNGCEGLTSLSIPNSVTSIGRLAFCNCSGLLSLTIPESVTSIMIGAFDNCRGITSITIPSPITSIEPKTFYNCNKLTSVTIPNSVTSIGGQAFFQCTKLPSVTIPNSVTSIGEKAFYSCRSLTEVYSLIEEPFAIELNVFQNTPEDAILFVPKGTKAKYEATDGWKEFKNIVEMGENPNPQQLEQQRQQLKDDLQKVADELSYIETELRKKTTEELAPKLYEEYRQLKDACATLATKVKIITSENDVASSRAELQTISDKTDALRVKVDELQARPGMPEDGQIIMERKYLVHHGGQYNYPKIILEFNNGKGLSVGYYDAAYWNPGGYNNSYKGILMSMDGEDTGWTISPVVVDEWVKEKIVVKANGQVAYYMNDSYMGEQTFEELDLQHAHNVRVVVTPYGWWTNHYQYMDDFKLTVGDNVISDNFNDGSINTDIWESPANPDGVREENGIMKMEQLRTDQDFTLRSKLIDITGSSSDLYEKIEAMKKDLEMETMKCMDMLHALSYELEKKDPEGVARELRQDLEYCAMYIKEAEYRVSICKTEDDIKDAQSQIEKMRAQLDYLNYQIEKLELEEPLTVTTVEGVKLTLKIISETEKTAQVGDGVNAALSQSTTGSVTIPATAGDYQIVAIAKWAFDGCHGLEAIHIPASVTSLSNNFLGNCRNLTSLTVAADNPVYNSPANSNAIVKTDNQTLVAACNSTVLPEGIETIGDYAFAYCDAMDYLNLQGVSTFHDYAFAYSNVRIIATGDINQIGFSLGAFNCSKVEMFYIRQTDGTVSMFCNGTMWRNAYAPGWAAPTFTTYTVPDEVHLGNQSFIVSKLGHSAFSNCTQLTEVTIPATITAIEGKYAFNKCTALHTITSLIKNPFAIDSELFVAEVYADATLYVPAGTKAKYQATEGWKEFKNIVEMAPEKGDIGGKGYTDVTDVVAAINHILGEQPLEETDAAVVDMNSDGEVNVADIILLVKQILEQGNHSETAHAARGDRKTVDLSRFTAMQLSVDVPTGSRLSGIRLAGRNNDTHQLMYQQAADGSYTVVVWSMDNQTFSPVDGRLIEVTVEGGGEAAARSVLLADKNGERLTLGSLPVGTATEITTVCTDGAATADIYDLRGNKVLTKGALMERLPKGVYIMDGKTIIK